MGQTRFTLNPKIKQSADELVEITGVDSYSNLLNLLITKYGQHLKQTWQLLPTTAIKTNTFREETVLALDESSCNQDTSQVPEIADPIISRIAGLIETF